MNHKLFNKIKHLLPLAIILVGLVSASPAWGAWGTGGVDCANQNKTASQTLACTVGQIMEAGNVAVVVCAGDNVSRPTSGKIFFDDFNRSNL